jgi:hypothetical protein
MPFKVSHIIELVKHLGGDHQKATQTLSGMDTVDPAQPQHADLLNSVGVDPQQLANGNFDQQLSNIAGQAPQQ